MARRQPLADGSARRFGADHALWTRVRSAKALAREGMDKFHDAPIQLADYHSLDAPCRHPAVSRSFQSEIPGFETLLSGVQVDRRWAACGPEQRDPADTPPDRCAALYVAAFEPELRATPVRLPAIALLEGPRAPRRPPRNMSPARPPLGVCECGIERYGLSTFATSNRRRVVADRVQLTSTTDGAPGALRDRLGLID